MAATRDRIADVKPYVERAMKDEDLRANLVAAFAAARQVYDELVGDRGVTRAATRVATDKDIQDNLKRALDELREAADRLQGKEPHRGRNTLLLASAVAIGVLANPVTGPATRKWIKDRVFGPSDDFGYGGGDFSSGGGDGGSAAGGDAGGGSVPGAGPPA